jgi:ubiquinone/menaquinone biosynthesis C-methylase UbiE
MKRDDWEAEATNWIAWARTPEHDSYHDYGPTFFEEVVPSAGRRTLDLGCGEGRLTRELRRRGHIVVGIDASATLVSAALNAEDGMFIVADGAHLPFSNDSFDLAVAYNVLMDLDDLPAALAEVARVLELGGRFAVCVLHPIAEAGSFGSRAPDEPFVIEGSYFNQQHYKQTFERDGLTMTFSSSTYPLEAYSRAFESAGFLIESIREPQAPRSAVSKDPGEERWRRVPIFLFLSAVRAR